MDKLFVEFSSEAVRRSKKSKNNLLPLITTIINNEVKKIRHTLNIHEDINLIVTIGDCSYWGSMSRKGGSELSHVPYRGILEISERTILTHFLGKNDIESNLVNTIMHELLHLISTDNMHHKGMWRMFANKINHAYNYHISRADSVSKYGVNAEDIYRYVIGCPKCETVRHGYARMVLGVKKPSIYCCARCHSDLVRIK